MSFPSVRGTIVLNHEAVGTTSHTITLPAIIVLGDLLQVKFCTDGTNETITWDQSSHGTWTQLFESNASSVAHTFVCWQKVADGTEDGGTLTITTGSSEQSAYISVAIQDWFGALSGVEVSIVAIGTDNDPDPASLTASWGTEDTMWVATFGCDGAPGMGASLTAFPFADNQTYNHPNVGGGDVDMAVCSEENATTTNNPSVFTGSDATGDDWSAYTIAIRPAAVSDVLQAQVWM